MSWDLDAYLSIGKTETHIGEWNYTHNCNEMIYSAGFKRWGGDFFKPPCTSQELLEQLSPAIKELKGNPKRYKAMNPSNGWGDYNTLLEVLIEIEETAKGVPQALWSAWF